jgi:hypothetical protein
VCGTTAQIAVDDEGYLIEASSKAQGWYHSGQQYAWFCRPCNNRETSALLEKLLRLCVEKGVEVRDLRGQVLIPGRSATDNSEE